MLKSITPAIRSFYRRVFPVRRRTERMMKMVTDIERINKENARRLSSIEKLVDAVSYNAAHSGAGAIKSIAESRVILESELASSKKEISNQQQARYNDILKLVKENEKQIKLLREEQVNRLEFLFNSHLNFKTALLGDLAETRAADREDNAAKFTSISAMLQSIRESEADRNYLFTRTYLDFKSQLGREFTEAKASIGRGWLEKYDKGLGQIAEVKTSIAALTDARSRDFSFVTKQQLGIQEILTASTASIQADLERLDANVEGKSKPVLDKLETVVASIGRLGGENREIIKLNKDIYEKILRTDDMRDIDTKLGLRDYKLKRIPKLHDVLNNFPQVVQDGKPFRFWEHDVEYIDRKALWIQINELLLREEYYFSDDREAAHRIIDCGANIGLALLFFKSLYPNSKILGFEPNKECFKVAQNNIKNNGLKDVVLLNAAVSDKEGRQKLFIDERDSMAASLSKRDAYAERPGSVATVKAVKLSSYLDEKVDLLKLDIEGSEAIVLKEVGSKLKSVKYLFCEYHFDEGNQENSLRDIIDILDDQKFDYQIAKSVWYSEHSEYRPFNFVGKRYSGIIYARNREFVVE